MGLELAKQAYIKGADLTLVVANVSVKIPSIFNSIFVKSTEEMNNVICDLIPDFDIYISTAAVSDFSPDSFEDHKISSDSSMSLILKPTVKIIRQIKELNPEIYLVGFKAEYNVTEEKIIESAYKQINNAKADLVIANDVGKENCNFGSDNNKILIIDDEIIKLPLLPKKDVAKIIADIIEKKI